MELETKGLLRKKVCESQREEAELCREDEGVVKSPAQSHTTNRCQNLKPANLAPESRCVANVCTACVFFCPARSCTLLLLKL